MNADTIETPHFNAGISSRHTWMMVLGCLAPLALLGILWFAGVSQSILTFGIILLCPIMHLVMMKGMKHGEMPASETKR